MNNIIEVVKEFKTRVEGLDFPIKARIIKEINGNELYFAEVSHYHKDFEFMDDSLTLTRSEPESIEKIIVDYLANFSIDNVRPNKLY